MISKKYSDFLMYRLLESVMVSSKDFLELIRSMNVDNKIADHLLKIIDSKIDIKTNYNYLDTSDTNDEISFLPDNQYQRFLSNGDNIVSKTKSKVSIGRAVRQILRDSGYSDYNDSDIEKFVNTFKSSWDKTFASGRRKVQIVKGDDIKKWYLEENYNSGNGTLGNSCMRFREKTEYMSIYSENPDKISLVILTENDKLLARSLLWNVDTCSKSNIKYFLDRIYTERDSDFDFLQNWVFDNVSSKDLISYHRDNINSINISVNLKKAIFPKYPYADSMRYLYPKIGESSGIISNWYDTYPDSEYVSIQIRSTDGYYENLSNHKWSEYLSRWMSSNGITWIESISSWVPESICKMCNFYGSFYLEDDVIWSEAMKDWIPKDRCIDSDLGKILPGAIKDVVVEYLTPNIDPIDLYISLSNGEKISSFFKCEKRIVGSDIFKSGDAYFGLNYFNDDMKVNTVTRENEPSLFCYQLYRVTGPSSMLDIDCFFIKTGVSPWMLKDDAKALGIEYDVNNFIYCSIQMIIDNHKDMRYDTVLKHISSCDGDDESKRLSTIFKTKIHNFLLINDDSYKFKNSLKSCFHSDSKMDIFVEFLDSVYSRIISQHEESFKRLIISRLVEYDEISMSNLSSDSSKKKIDYIMKLYKFYIGYYILCEDSYDSCDYLSDTYDSISNKKEFGKIGESPLSEPFSHIVDGCVKWLFRKSPEILQVCINDEIIKIMDSLDNTHGVSRYLIRRYVASISCRDYRIYLTK